MARGQRGPPGAGGPRLPLTSLPPLPGCLSAHSLPVLGPCESRRRRRALSGEPAGLQRALELRSAKQEHPKDGDGTVLAAFSRPNRASRFLLLLEVVIQNPATLTEMVSR